LSNAIVRRDEFARTGKTEEDVVAPEELITELRRTLPSVLEHHPIRLAYLYGSAATGKVTPFSDTDLALIVQDGLTPLECLKLILHIQVDLADCCDIPNADVRIVNDAPLIFRGRVICDGILVYARDEQERVEFEAGTRMRYFDYMLVHQRLQEAFFASLRERGLYG